MITIEQLQKTHLSPSSEVRIAPEDFFVLLAEAAGKDKAFLHAHPEHALGARAEALAKEYFSRRLKCEPVAYIVGHKEFFGLDFQVTQATLIPRPETELLVELVLDKISNFPASPAGRQFLISKKIAIIDIGTGSGNIIISIAKALSAIKFKIQDSRFFFYATDISLDALTVAKENSKRHRVDDLITFHHGDLIEPLLKKDFSDTHVIVTANLPYLSEEIYRTTDNDVKDFEPRSALVSDEEGLAHAYRLLEQLRSKPFFSLNISFEISPEQGALLPEHIQTLFPKADITVIPDLSGRDRVVSVSLH